MVLSLTFVPHSLLAQESQRGPMVVEGSSACEDNIANLEGYVAVAQESKERIFVIARLGRGESSRRLTRRRLHNAQRFLSVVRGLKSERLVFAEGEPSNGKGRVEFYLGGELVLVSVVERGGDLCVCCCEHARCGRYYGWGKKDNRRR